MKGAVAFVWCLLLLSVQDISAESLCVKCLVEAQTELRKCLEAAISRQDKNACIKKQEVRSKTCEDGQCKIEKAAETGNVIEGAHASEKK